MNTYMSRIVKLILIFLVTWTSQLSVADNKIRIPTPEKADEYIIKSTIKKIKSETYRYWTETIYKEDIYGKIGLLYRKGQSTKMIIELDCKNETRAIIAMIVYDENKEVVSSIKKDGAKMEKHYIAPNTYAELGKLLICHIE